MSIDLGDAVLDLSVDLRPLAEGLAEGNAMTDASMAKMAQSLKRYNADVAQIGRSVQTALALPAGHNDAAIRDLTRFTTGYRLLGSAVTASLTSVRTQQALTAAQTSASSRIQIQSINDVTRAYVLQAGELRALRAAQGDIFSTNPGLSASSRVPVPVSSGRFVGGGPSPIGRALIYGSRGGNNAGSIDNPVVVTLEAGQYADMGARAALIGAASSAAGTPQVSQGGSGPVLIPGGSGAGQRTSYVSEQTHRTDVVPYSSQSDVLRDLGMTMRTAFRDGMKDAVADMINTPKALNSGSRGAVIPFSSSGGGGRGSGTTIVPYVHPVAPSRGGGSGGGPATVVIDDDDDDWVWGTPAVPVGGGGSSFGGGGGTFGGGGGTFGGSGGGGRRRRRSGGSGGGGTGGGSGGGGGSAGRTSPMFVWVLNWPPGFGSGGGGGGVIPPVTIGPTAGGGGGSGGGGGGGLPPGLLATLLMGNHGGSRVGSRLPILRWFGGVGGAGFGSLGSFAGLGPEHILATAGAVAGSAGTGLAGAGLLGAGALATTAVGAGSDLLVTKSTLADTKQIYTAYQQVTTAVQTYSANSRQAALAQKQLNDLIKTLGDTVGVKAEVVLAQNAQALNTLFDKESGAARVQSANILEQGLNLGNVYLPLVLKAATQNLTIINRDIKPLFTWLEGPEGIGIWNNLENNFKKGLPDAVQAFSQGMQLFLRVVSLASNYTGGLTKSLDHFFTRLNSKSDVTLNDEIGKLIGDFRMWESLIKVIGIDIYDLFRNDAGTGASIVVSLTKMLTQLGKWERSTKGESQLHTIFDVHKDEVLSLMKLLPPLVSSFSSLYLDIAPALTGAFTTVVKAIAAVIKEASALSPLTKDLIGLLLVAGKLGFLPGLLRGVAGGLGLISRTAPVTPVVTAATGGTAATGTAGAAGTAGLLSRVSPALVYGGLGILGGTIIQKSLGLKTGTTGTLGGGIIGGGLGFAVAGPFGAALGAAIGSSVGPELLHLFSPAKGKDYGTAFAHGFVKPFADQLSKSTDQTFTKTIHDSYDKVAAARKKLQELQKARTPPRTPPRTPGAIGPATGIGEAPPTPHIPQSVINTAKKQVMDASTELGTTAAQQVISAMQSVPFPTGLALSRDFIDQLRKLGNDPVAQDTAAKQMIHFAAGLQKNGKLPKGAVDGIIKELEGQFTGLSAFLQAQGPINGRILATSMRFTDARKTLVESLNKARGDFLLFDSDPVVTGKNWRRNLTIEMRQLRIDMQSGTRQAREGAEAELTLLASNSYQTLTKMVSSSNAQFTALGLQAKQGSFTAAGSITSLLATTKHSIENLVHAGVMSQGEGNFAIAQETNKALKAMGSVKKITIASVSNAFSGIAGGNSLPNYSLPGGGAPNLATAAYGAASAITLGRAGGGLIQVGQRGARGQDNIPMSVGGMNIVVGAGEQVAVFNHSQQQVMDNRLKDMGGLSGMFKSVNTPHAGYAQGGFVGPTMGKAQLEALWTAAGGPAKVENTAAAIALAESRGQDVTNSIGACVPLSTKILTRRGWLAHDEVQVGDETLGYNPDTGCNEWTAITQVFHYASEEILRIGNKNWKAEVTPGHRWWSDTRTKKGPRGEFVRTESLISDNRLRLAAPAETDGIPNVTPDECAILGWLMGDGHIRRAYAQKMVIPSARTRDGLRDSGWRAHTDEVLGWDACIYQSKPQQIIRLRELLADIPYAEGSRERGTGLISHEFRLRREYATELLDRMGWQEINADPEAWILKLSPEQRHAWVTAMIDAEGCNVSGSAPHHAVHVRMAQVDGPVQEAIKLAVYLEGCQPSYVRIKHREGSNWQPSGYVGMRTPHTSVQGFGQTLSLGRQPVWCVATGLGTWTMRQEGALPCLTGNSGYWQIYGLPFPGNPLIPSVNARMAVEKWREAGESFSPWVTFEDGSYKSFLGAGSPFAGNSSFAGMPQQIATPKVSGDGAQAAMIQASLNLSAQAANALLANIAGGNAAGGGVGGAGGGTMGSIGQTLVPHTAWNPEGKPIASWIVPVLSWAAQHGWSGSVTSGYRSYSDQSYLYQHKGTDGISPIVAVPGTSNHEKTGYPGGAVDVDGGSDTQLMQILRGYNGPKTLRGGNLGPEDPYHFSHTGFAGGGMLCPVCGGDHPMSAHMAGGGKLAHAATTKIPNVPKTSPKHHAQVHQKGSKATTPKITNGLRNLALVNPHYARLVGVLSGDASRSTSLVDALNALIGLPTEVSDGGGVAAGRYQLKAGDVKDLQQYVGNLEASGTPLSGQFKEGMTYAQAYAIYKTSLRGMNADVKTNGSTDANTAWGENLGDIQQILDYVGSDPGHRIIDNQDMGVLKLAEPSKDLSWTAFGAPGHALDMVELMLDQSLTKTWQQAMGDGKILDGDLNADIPLFTKRQSNVLKIEQSEVKRLDGIQRQLAKLKVTDAKARLVAADAKLVQAKKSQSYNITAAHLEDTVSALTSTANTYTSGSANTDLEKVISGLTTEVADEQARPIANTLYIAQLNDTKARYEAQKQDLQIQAQQVTGMKEAYQAQLEEVRAKKTLSTGQAQILTAMESVAGAERGVIRTNLEGQLTPIEQSLRVLGGSGTTAGQAGAPHGSIYGALSGALNKMRTGLAANQSLIASATADLPGRMIDMQLMRSNLGSGFDTSLLADVGPAGAGAAAAVQDDSALLAAKDQQIQNLGTLNAILEDQFSVLNNLPPFVGAFALGGTVPGALGEPGMALVHGGEQVLTPDQQSNPSDVRVRIEDHRVRVWANDVEKIINSSNRTAVRRATRGLAGRGGGGLS